ncbi:hypothetical protein IWQ61_008093 [Dispira simplex]|nr:hypothetical protein IWQ61_008093 [Dispira simplex]
MASASQQWNWESFLEDEDMYVMRLEECVKDIIRPLKDHRYIQTESLAIVFNSVQDIRNHMVNFAVSATNVRYQDPTDQLLLNNYLEALLLMVKAYKPYLNHYIQGMSEFIGLTRRSGVKSLLGWPAGTKDSHMGAHHWKCYLSIPAHRLSAYLTSLRSLDNQNQKIVDLEQEIQILLILTTHILGQIELWQQWVESLTNITVDKALGSAGSKGFRRLLEVPTTVFSLVHTLVTYPVPRELVMNHPESDPRQWLDSKNMVLLDNRFQVRKVYRTSWTDLNSHHNSLRLIMLPEFILPFMPADAAERKSSGENRVSWRLATAYITRNKVRLTECTQSGGLDLIINDTVVAKLACSVDLKELWLKTHQDSAPHPMRPIAEFGVSSTHSFFKKFTSMFVTRKIESAVKPEGPTKGGVKLPSPATTPKPASPHPAVVPIPLEHEGGMKWSKPQVSSSPTDSLRDKSSDGSSTVCSTGESVAEEGSRKGSTASRLHRCASLFIRNTDSLRLSGFYSPSTLPSPMPSPTIPVSLSSTDVSNPFTQKTGPSIRERRASKATAPFPPKPLHLTTLVAQLESSPGTPCHRCDLIAATWQKRHVLGDTTMWTSPIMKERSVELGATTLTVNLSSSGNSYVLTLCARDLVAARRSCLFRLDSSVKVVYGGPHQVFLTVPGTHFNSSAWANMGQSGVDGGELGQPMGFTASPLSPDALLGSATTYSKNHPFPNDTASRELVDTASEFVFKLVLCSDRDARSLVQFLNQLLQECQRAILSPPIRTYTAASEPTSAVTTPHIVPGTTTPTLLERGTLTARQRTESSSPSSPVDTPPCITNRGTLGGASEQLQHPVTHRSTADQFQGCCQLFFRKGYTNDWKSQGTHHVHFDRTCPSDETTAAPTSSPAHRSPWRHVVTLHRRLHSEPQAELNLTSHHHVDQSQAPIANPTVRMRLESRSGSLQKILKHQPDDYDISDYMVDSTNVKALGRNRLLVTVQNPKQESISFLCCFQDREAVNNILQLVA